MPIPVRLLVLPLLLLHCTRVSAQNDAGSLPNPQLEAVLERLDTTWKEDPQAAVDQIELLLREAPQPGRAQYIHALQLKGRAHRNLGDYVSAIENWKAVHQYATQTRDSTMLVEAADQIGIMKTFMGSYREAQPYLLEVAAIQDRIGTNADRAGAMNGLAILFNDMEREEEAIEMYQRSLELYLLANDTMGQAAVNANLGLLHTTRGEYDLAEKYLLEQGRLDSIYGTQYGLGFHYDFMAYLRREQGRLGEALQLARQSLAVRLKLPSHYNVAESRITVANVLLALERYREAIDLANKVLEFKEDHQSLSQESNAYHVLSEAHEGLGNFPAALEAHKRYKEASDSIYRRDHLEEITTQSALYEKAKQDEEIAQLGQLNSIKEAEIQRKNLALWVVGAGILLTSLFALAVWGLFKKISRQKEALQVLHNQKDTLLREIHHRVKNNLQMVSSLLALQSEYIQDDAALDALQMGQRRVRSMAIIHQKLYMRNEAITEVSARSYLDQLIGELMATLNVRGLPLRLEKDLEDIDLDIDRMIPLGLIANEVITNAMKYAFTGRATGLLRVKFYRKGENIALEIADDGRGVEENLITGTDSFGSLLIQTLAEQLDGELSIFGEEGTRVRLVFPR